MADQIQLRGGTATESAAFTGASREVTVDTTNNTLRVHDGTTAGGHMLAKQADLSTTQSAQTAALSALGVGTNSLHLGTFTGSTLADNQSVKQLLQSIETLLENKASTLGTAGTDTSLGAFTGSTIADNQSVKQALQALETTLEAVDIDTDDLAVLTGIAENVTNLGTFTGSTISDSSAVKGALQELETAVELRASKDTPAFTGQLATLIGSATLPVVHRIQGGFPDINLRTNGSDVATDQNEGRLLWEDAGGGGVAAIKQTMLPTAPMRFFVGGITDNEERLRILANGRVGIGEINPQAQLHVGGSVLVKADFPDFQMRSGGERRVIFEDAGGGAEGAIKFASNVMTFFTGGISGSEERLRIAANGRIGIGNANPQAQLHVQGSALVQADFPDFQMRSGGEKRLIFEDNGGGALAAIKCAGQHMKLFAGGVAGSDQIVDVNTSGITFSSGKALNLDSVALTTVQTSAEAFADNDTSLMTSAAINDLVGASGTTLADLGITSTAAELNILDGVTSTAAELNILDGVTSTAAELNILDGVTSTAAELNLLDGVTATTAELNYVDGVTSNIQTQLDALQSADAELTELATMASTAAAAIADLTSTEIQILDGATVTTAELNILDGVTSTAAELNILDGVTSTAAELNILDGVTSTAAELNILDGVTATAAELNYVDGVTSAIQTQIDGKYATSGGELTGSVTITTGFPDLTLKSNGERRFIFADAGGGANAALKYASSELWITYGGVASGDVELKVTDGAIDIINSLKIDGTAVTSTAAELNILDGVTSTAAELNILDGVTSTAAELNILDGVTATTAEINVLDGATAGTAVASKAVVLDSNKDITGIRDLTITGDLSVQGTTTTVNTVTMEAANAVVFEGATADDNETTLTIVDPNADRTIKLPNQSGCLPVLAADSTTAITATPEELNILDGVTSTAAELNILDGVTATAAELNILDGVTSTAAELNILDGVTSTAAELNILDGVTSTAAELNLLDGVTATTAELNYVDGVTSAIQTQLDAKLASSGAQAALHVDHIITLSGVAQASDDLGTFSGSTISDSQTIKQALQALETAVEGKQATDTDLTNLAGCQSGASAAIAALTQAEVEILDGATVTTAELNILDGVTSTAAELNILDGVTSTAAELNILDGVTATAAEINLLDGVTATTAELNYVDGVTSAVQTQLNAKLDSSGAQAALHVDHIITLSGVAQASDHLGTFTGSTISDNGTIKAGMQELETAIETKQASDAELTELATMASATAAALADLSEAEVQILDGATVTTAELNILDGVTSTAAELNILDGVTSTAAELNILDGVTSTAAELNILDGVTSTAAELNILDGVTASAADINLIDGITNGTVIASKAIITDSDKDISGGRNITISGELDAGSLDISGDADIDGTANLDAVDIDGAVDMASTLIFSGGLTNAADDTAAASAGVAVNQLYRTDSVVKIRVS